MKGENSRVETFYAPRQIKHRRRTKAEMDAFRHAILSVLADDHPRSVRGVYYKLVTLGVIEKVENQYDAVDRATIQMRLAGELPFEWISDGTRWVMRPRFYPSLLAGLENLRETDLQDIWADQPCHLEFWCEKDALGPLFYQETEPFAVPLYVARGFSSISFLHGAAKAIIADGKPAYIYYFGDFDPSGRSISHSIETRLRQFAPDADITFVRVAVNEEQIEQLHLPTRPTKTSDKRHKNHVDESGNLLPSVELDAIDSPILRRMVRECIERHIDWDALARTEKAAQHDRRFLEKLIQNIKWPG